MIKRIINAKKMEGESGTSGDTAMNYNAESLFTCVEDLQVYSALTQNAVNSLNSLSLGTDLTNASSLTQGLSDSMKCIIGGSDGGSGVGGVSSILAQHGIDVLAAVISSDAEAAALYDQHIGNTGNTGEDSEESGYDFGKWLVNDVIGGSAAALYNYAIGDAIKEQGIYTGLAANGLNAMFGLITSTVQNLVTSVYVSAEDGIAAGVSNFASTEIGNFFNAGGSIFKDTVKDRVKDNLINKYASVNNLTLEDAKDLLDDRVGNFNDFAEYSLKTSGVALGLDYLVSLGSNAVVGLANDGKLTVDELKLGSTALKSVFKGIGGFCGEILGGPAGRAVGTQVGSVAGSLATVPYTDSEGNIDEVGCGIAAGATLAGAGAAAIITVAAGCAAVPVVGWVIGAGLLAYGVTTIIYKAVTT